MGDIILAMFAAVLLVLLLVVRALRRCALVPDDAAASNAAAFAPRYPTEVIPRDIAAPSSQRNRAIAREQCWYGGKNCGLYWKPVHDLVHADQHQALLNPVGNVASGSNRPEEVPHRMANSIPLCWDCFESLTFACKTGSPERAVAATVPGGHNPASRAGRRALAMRPTESSSI
jgi:hypothetical protein